MRTLDNKITEQDLVEFNLYPIKDQTAVTQLVDIKNLEASEQLINFVIRTLGWRGYSYQVNNITLIGYGTRQNTDSKGLTEQQAYSDWINDFKSKEKKFKSLFPLDKLTQSQYDGLVSMFYFTGSFLTVGSQQRLFDLTDYIKKQKWEYIATAMIESGADRLIRQQEAKIIMLADYGKPKDRSLIKEQGIQDIRKMYPDRLSNTKSKQQAEYVYYAETGKFLPSLTMSRMREIVKLNS